MIRYPSLNTNSFYYRFDSLPTWDRAFPLYPLPNSQYVPLVDFLPEEKESPPTIYQKDSSKKIKSEKRLKIVEKELNILKNKLVNQEKLLSVRKRTDHELRTMANEIQLLRTQRVRLSKQKSKENEIHRKY